jgi:hypothetical protein
MKDKAKDNLAEIKEKYGEVFEIIVEDKKAYIRKPNRLQLGPVLATISSNPIAAFEMLFSACVIPEISDMEILTNDDYFLGACAAMDGIISLKKSSLKKL